jgi:AcrR family transcriptional regulator
MQRVSPKRPAKKTASEEDTRDRLIAAASRVFAAKGYDGASVRDIASAAGVNVSLVSYYFKGKDGLHRACLEEFGKNRLAESERILAKPNSYEEFKVRLSMWMAQVLEMHATQSEVCAMIHQEWAREVLRHRDVIEATFVRIFQNVVAYATSAQKRGWLRADFDPLLVIGLFYGGILHFGRMDHSLKKFLGRSISDSKYRQKVVDEGMEMLLRGIGK